MEIFRLVPAYVCDALHFMFSFSLPDGSGPIFGLRSLPSYDRTGLFSVPFVTESSAIGLRAFPPPMLTYMQGSPRPFPL